MASKVQREVVGVIISGSGLVELLITFQCEGAVTVSAKAAFRSGCSKQANIRRASADSNCV